MRFTTKNINGLQNTVSRYHLQFIAEQAGMEPLTISERTLLQNAGVDLNKYKGKRTPVEESYWFGKMESSVRNKKYFNRLDLKQFRQFMDENPALFKLKKEDRLALKWAKQAFANDVRRLMGDIKSDLEHSLLEISKTTTPKTPKREILKTLSTNFAANTLRYSGRMELISSYRMHETFQTGISQEILERLGPNAKVYYSVHSDVCPICKKIYLKPSGEPRIFLLKTVMQNGSNIGKKNSEKRASIGPIHPRCRCKMNLLPKGKVKFSKKQNHYIRTF